MVKIGSQSNARLYTFFTADALSGVGNVLYYVALLTFASNLKNSALAISLITTLELVPPLFSVFLGRIADSLKNKMVSISVINFFQGALYIFNGIAFLLLDAWQLLIACLIINFISDLIGSLSDQLQPAVLSGLSPQTSLDVKFGLFQSVSQVVSIIGKFLGGIIITSLSNNFAIMSLINSVTFFSAGVLVIIIRNYKRVPSESEKNNSTQELDTFSIREFLRGHTDISVILVFMSLMNFILAPLLPMLFVLISTKGISGAYSYSISISILSGVDAMASILGPIMGPKIFNNSDGLRNSLLAGGLASSLFCLSFILGKFWIVVVCLFVSSFFVMSAIPIMYGRIMGDLSEEHMGEISGFVDTILAFVAPASTFLFTSLTSSTTIKMISIGFAVGCAVLIVFVYHNQFHLRSRGD